MDRLLDYSIDHTATWRAGCSCSSWCSPGSFASAALRHSPVANEAIRLANSGAVLVDLRSPNQYKDGHIAGARNLRVAQWPNPKAAAKLADKTVVLCCDTGVTTAAAQRTLTQAGARTCSVCGATAAPGKRGILPVVEDTPTSCPK